MPFAFLRRRRSQRGDSLSRRGSKKGSKKGTRKRKDQSIDFERLMEQMPPEPELNEKFAEVVDELDLSGARREGVFALPPEAKWRLYLNQKFKHLSGDDSDVGQYISDVKRLTGAPYPPDTQEQQSRTKLADGLKTALRTQTQSFVNQFVQSNGLDCLLEFLQQMDHQTRQSAIHTAIIGCIKALLNNTYGRGHVLSHVRATNIIAQSLYTDNVKTKVAVYEIMGAVCLVPGGHKNVLKAMTHLQHYASERTRLQTVVLDLDRSTGVYREEFNLKTAVMSLLNALLCCGSGEDHLEFRVHLRYEFLMLGFQPVFVKLREQSNPALDRHLDFFELMRKDDERELASRFGVPHIDTSSASAMLDVLKRKLAHSASYPHLLSLLHHCLMIPVEGDYLALRWKLLDHVVQQVVLQKEGPVDPDLEPLKINVEDIVHHLFREEEMEKLTAEAEQLKKTQDEIQSKLAKKERECEVRTQEKEDVKKALNKIMTKLEKEQKELREYKIREKELNASVTELRAKLEREMQDRVRLESLLERTSVSLPDDAKAAAGIDAARLSLKLSGVELASQPVAPPPPPPGLAAPPPPPPPAPGGLMPPGPPPPPGAPGFGSSKQKKIPKASNAMKSFNWSKLGEVQVKSTVWKDLDDAPMFRLLDLSEFERTFSAYQKKEGSTEDLSQLKAKPKELSVIDGRRAQNCTILLSKLKMSNEELKLVVLSMDDDEEVTTDMVEQILKYVPQQDEVQLLLSHKDEIDKMARADRFLYEMSKIDHYGQRIAVLFYKKRFNERVDECRPKVEAIFRASREIARSTRLRRLLEIVLAFGNYMNRGARSNAFGFRISSLNKIVDTKSSSDRRVTLLHYLIETVQNKFPEVVQLERDLPNVRSAAKVNMTELETEMLALKQGMDQVKKELNYRSKQASRELGDRFVDIVSDFESLASVQLAELDETLIDAKLQFNKSVSLFGEEPTKTQPDDFFGIFSTFLQSFEDARQENQVMRRKREEDARKAREMGEQKDREKRAAERRKREQASLATDGRRGKPKAVGKSESGEFDDLITALHKGDVFGEDLAKFRRKHGRRPSGTGENGKSPKRVIGIQESRERSPAGD